MSAMMTTTTTVLDEGMTDAEGAEDDDDASPPWTLQDTGETRGKRDETGLRGDEVRVADFIFVLGERVVSGGWGKGAGVRHSAGTTAVCMHITRIYTSSVQYCILVRRVFAFLLVFRLSPCCA